MANEFDVTPKSTSPYASPVTIGAPPSGTSPVTVGAFGESPTVASIGDGVSTLTPEKRLLIIINSTLGTEYDDIEEAKTKAKAAIPEMADSTLKDNFKKLIDDYEAAEDETAKKKALDTFEKNIGGNPSISDPSVSMPSMPDFSAAGVPGVSLSPNLPGTPGFQSYPMSGAGTNDPLSAIPQAIQQIGTAFNPNASQTAGAGTAGGASASASILVGYKDALEKAEKAEDIKWGTPQTVQYENDTTKTAAAVNEPIGEVSGHFEDGNYVLNNDKKEDQIKQVTDDQAKIDQAITATNEDAKNTYLSKGNDAAQELFKNGKATTDEVHGSPDGGSPKSVIENAKGKIPEVQKAQYEKVREERGLEEDDAANRGEVKDKYVKEKTTVSDVESVIEKTYGKKEDNIGVLQGKLDYLAGVKQGAQADYTKFQGEMTRAEQARNNYSRMASSAADANLSGHYQDMARQAEVDRKEAEKKMEERQEVLNAAKEKKRDVEKKLKASAEARTTELTAIKSGANDKVAAAKTEKQTKADAVQNAVNAIVNKVQNGVADAKENGVANFANMEAPDASLFNKDATGIVDKFNGEVSTLKSTTEAKLAQLKKTKEMLEKILAELKKDKSAASTGGGSGAAAAPAAEGTVKMGEVNDGKQTVKIVGQPFNLSGAKAETPEKTSSTGASTVAFNTNFNNSNGSNLPADYIPGEARTLET